GRRRSSDRRCCPRRAGPAGRGRGWWRWLSASVCLRSPTCAFRLWGRRNVSIDALLGTLPAAQQASPYVGRDALARTAAVLDRAADDRRDARAPVATPTAPSGRSIGAGSAL